MRTKKRPKNLKANRCDRSIPCNAPLKVYKDSSVVLTQDQLKELELIHQHKLHSYQQYVENISLPRVSEQILEQFKRSIDPSKQYYWITVTYDKKYAAVNTSVLEAVLDALESVSIRAQVHCRTNDHWF